jgi:hypothetical protein
VKKLTLGVCAAALSLPAMTSAAAAAGQVVAYATNPTIDSGGTRGNSGTGFGARGWAMLNPSWFLHGEYQSTDMSDTNAKLDSLRLGGGFIGALGGETKWLAKGEYVDFGSDLDQSGFGVHGGIILAAESPLSYFGTLGYLNTDDTDGLELDAGAHYAFTRCWGVVLDYRNYMGRVDPSGGFDVSEFRLGGTFTFN